MSPGRLVALALIATLTACTGSSDPDDPADAGSDGGNPSADAPLLPSSALGETTVGAPFQRSLAATGGTSPLTYSARGPLPAGLSLDARTGLLSGALATPGSVDIDVLVTDGLGRSDQRRYPLLVLEAPRLVTSTLAPASVSVAYSARFEATGGKAPLTFAISAGALPAGLVLEPSGLLSGTPTSPGPAVFELSVTDAHGAVKRAPFALEVRLSGPSIVTSVLPGTYVARAYTFNVVASGGTPPYSWHVSAGTLPPDIELTSSGELIGTPFIPGSFGITLTVQDAALRSASRAFTLTVFSPPGFASSTLRDGVLGSAYSDVLRPSGGVAPYSFRILSGALPAGLRLSGDALTGTPTTAGTASFTVEVRDANDQIGTQAFTLRIAETLAVTSGTLPDAYTDSAYDHALTAAGGRPPYRWTLDSGAPPAGISLLTSGQLGGTPSAPGTGSFTARVADADDATASRGLSVTAYAPPSLAAVPSRSAYVSDVINLALAVTGGKAPYSFSSSGSLPPGLSLAASTGLLQGTLTGAGSFSFDVTARDANGRTSTRTLAFTVYALPTITTTSLPEAVLGQPYSRALGASGGRPDYSWSLESGTLPEGMSLSSTGVISGTPTGSGSSFTVRVSDASGRTDTRTLILSVYAPPRITTASLPEATVGTPYTVVLGYTGGRGTLSWGSSGTLPPGLAFGSDGSVSGTPTASGTWSFTVTLQDSAGGSDSRVFPLTVRASAPDGGSPDGGSPDGGIPVFTVGHWNVEWFGSDTQGPPRSTSPGGALDDLQIANAGAILGDAGVNLWGLVEMVDSADFATLKAQLPGYDGFLSNDPRVALGSTYYLPNEQKLGVLYDSRLTFQDAGLILTSASVDFAGRPPMRVDFSTRVHGTPSPLVLIVLHMKAFDDSASYDRRQRASIALKNYLDSLLPSHRVLVVGDWNDDVDVSITRDGGVPVASPYENLLNAPGDYAFVTRPLSLAGERSTVSFPDMIDHTLVTNEVLADYVTGSARVLRPGWIADYSGTTSDHYPVLNSYNFGPGALSPPRPSEEPRAQGSPF
jgi:hypothetical protein